MSTQNTPTLVVGRVDVATAQATGISTLLPKSIVFSAAGDIQAITAVGNVVDLGTSANAALLAANNTFTGRNLFQPVLATSGSAFALKVTSAANTGQAAGVNAPAVDLNLSASVQFATGAMAALTAIRVQAPTYTFVGASTVTNAATLYIDAAPSVTAPSTATNSYAILVATGNVRFGDNIITGGNLSFAGAAPSITATAANQGIALASNGNGAITLDAGAGTGGVQIGVNAASLVGLYAAAPVARAAAITPIGAFTDPPSAAEMAALRTGVNAIITALQNIGVTL